MSHSGALIGTAQYNNLQQSDNFSYNSVAPLLISALIFIVIFFWVQSFYVYWQIWFGEAQDINGFLEKVNKKNPNVLLTFTLFLTFITIGITTIYYLYGGQHLVDIPDVDEFFG